MEILTKIISDGRYSLAENEVKNVQKNGKSICFTGALATMGRKEASKLAENAGFEVKSGVSKGLTYLVTNNPNSGSSKNDKARKLGTLVIDEKQFLELIKTADQEVFDL
jgi:DNA ligase (NAD+)